MMYWIIGLSTIGSISLGIAFVAGNICIPKPATGITAFKLIIFRATSKWLEDYKLFEL